MTSRRKRTSYVTESDTSSGEDAEYSSFQGAKRLQRSGGYVNLAKVKHDYDEDILDGDKKNRCVNRNALMARENRKRKKMYVENLESEISKLRDDRNKLNSVVDNQSFLISELQKQIKYLKSVLANSSDISNLIKNIQNSTGMSVTTSLDKTLTLNNSCISKPNPYIARKTAHPWEESSESICDIPIVDQSLPTTSSLSDYNSDFDFVNAFDDLDFTLPDFQFNINNNGNAYLSNEVPEIKDCRINNPYFMQDTCNDHNYSNILTNEKEEDVGVCLHVSRHRVSLEFCSSCSENAVGAWKGLDELNG